MIVFVIMLTYIAIAGSSTAFFIAYDIGVDDMDDYIGAIFLGIFWPFTIPFLIGFVIAKNAIDKREKEVYGE